MLDYHSLNALLAFPKDDGSINFDADKEAVKQYFLTHVNTNTVFFHSLEEKIDYLIDNEYYEKEVFDLYTFSFIKSLFKKMYAMKFRFPTFMGAFKFYTQYAMKTFDGSRYIERYEDRVSMTALYLSQGDKELAVDLAYAIIKGEYQPATPTFLNAGKKQRGELISCFLYNVSDSMEAISRAINASLQLSKRGGGVALCLTNLRETGAPIKKIENQSSGVVPVMKILEDSFSYANQLGARQGAGAVYLNVHHPDILSFLDTKRENADEKIRIKTLSLGLVVPDITFELAKRNEEMYLFSPYDIERVYGIPMSDISVTEKYHEMVANPEIKKKTISARKLFQTIAEIQFESGYPYLMYEDTVNRANPVEGRINMSNLCVAGDTQILTKNGYKVISEVVGTKQEIWNGEEWSEVDIIKTGGNQELIRVETDSGEYLDCTPYHKFYVITRYGKKPVEKRAFDLKEDDKLIKLVTPIIEGTKTFEKPYTNGFFSGDGCEYKGVQKIYLYGDKKSVIDRIEYRRKDIWNERISLYCEDLYPKYTVPNAEYTINSRIEWLTGLSDSDGTIARNGSNEALQISSIHYDFLVDVKRMLDTLGVHSKIKNMHEARVASLPANDGTGDYKDYNCKAVFRLLIGSNDLVSLIKLGFNPSRLSVNSGQVPQRNASQFVKIKSLSKIEGLHDTYCFNEPKRHMGVFNGILTGQCSEILQVNTPSSFNEDLTYKEVGKDISCNLGSLNIYNAMHSDNLEKLVTTSILALNSVSEMSSLVSVPSIKKGNEDSRAIGLGQMNLHGYLASEKIHYGSEESIDFTNMYFYIINYHALKASNELAKKKGKSFVGFEKSKYFTGEYFDKYINQVWEPKTDKVKELFKNHFIPKAEDWAVLKYAIKEDGLYNQNLQAVPPTGSISYINNSTSSIHPIVDKIEIRKEGKIGRVYYPAPHLTNENIEYYKDAYEIGPEKIIDIYAAATQHVDQGLSLTLFFKDTATTKDINKAQIYAWTKGIKTLYYIRIRKESIVDKETKTEEICESCVL